MTSTNGGGIDYIKYFVGSDQTLALATEISRPQGRIVVNGMEGRKCQGRMKPYGDKLRVCALYGLDTSRPERCLQSRDSWEAEDRHA